MRGTPIERRIRMTIDMKSLARLGAYARITELVEEMEALLRAFPELGQYRVSTRQPEPAATGAAPKKPRRRRMSAAARKAVSARMKKYWAGRRQAKKG
jgi:hypothetical protein